MLKFGENEPDKVEEICTAAQAKVAAGAKELTSLLMDTVIVLPGAEVETRA
jgi:hypothetical protein